MNIAILASVFFTVFFVILAAAGGKKEDDLMSLLDLSQQKESSKPKLQLSKVIIGGLTSRISALKYSWLVKYRDDVRQKLNQAGNPAELTPDGFITLVLVSIIGMILLEVLFLKKINIVAFGIFGIMGYFLPNASLKNMITKRHHSILRELPNILDLLTLSMEAGIDFNAAVNKVISKSEKSPLTDELRLMQQGLRLGQSRKESMTEMSKRVSLDALTSVISAIIQADNLGASLGPVLRVQSEQMRIERFQLAEKLAHQAPVKMLFPLMFFIFPSIVIMLFGPLALKFMGGVFGGVF
ncbi:MAG: type II secretion system F family protein [Elusimicrobiota bacterium]|nr:type II secretion system F family protein [Elusimicrobiota bacterium]